MTNALIIGQASLKSWEKNTTRSYFEKLSQSIFPRPSLYFCDNTQLQTMAQGNFTFGEKAAAAGNPEAAAAKPTNAVDTPGNADSAAQCAALGRNSPDRVAQCVPLDKKILAGWLVIADQISRFTQTYVKQEQLMMAYLRQLGWQPRLVEQQFGPSKHIFILVENPRCPTPHHDGFPVVIDFRFKELFDVARPTLDYQSHWARARPVYLGPQSQLFHAVQFFSERAAFSMVQQKICLPPWRHFKVLEAAYRKAICENSRQFRVTAADTSNPQQLCSDMHSFLQRLLEQTVCASPEALQPTTEAAGGSVPADSGTFEPESEPLCTCSDTPSRTFPDDEESLLTVMLKDAMERRRKKVQA
uniref:Uncharacterized protein n=1 Tax=Eutreptiella gymnastica TaxID=73025 RepID=A0A7S4LKV3_9EUGL